MNKIIIHKNKLKGMKKVKFNNKKPKHQYSKIEKKSLL